MARSVQRDRRPVAFAAEVISLAIIVIMTAVSHWIISARMQALRAAMGVIDQTSLADPRRMEFDALHRYSVMAMSVAMIAGLVAFFAMNHSPARADRPTARADLRQNPS